MDAYYKLPLPAIDSVRASFPEEFARLDALTSTQELQEFGSEARDRAKTSEAWMQVSRYAAIREIQSRLPVPAVSIAGHHIDNCVAERVWMASFRSGKVDAVTERLIAKRGFLGGMIEQLKPISRVGEGNFKNLRKDGLVDCTAEYCVWRWGLEYVGQELRDKLADTAVQHGFHKL
jgi:hypothetical protein